MRDAPEKAFLLYTALVIGAVVALSLSYPSVVHTMEFGHEKIRLSLLVVLAAAAATRLRGPVFGVTVTAILAAGALGISFVSDVANYDVDLVFDVLTLLLVSTGVVVYTGLLSQRLRSALDEEAQHVHVLNMSVDLVPRELDDVGLTRLLAAVEIASRASRVVFYRHYEGRALPTPRPHASDAVFATSANRVAELMFDTYRERPTEESGHADSLRPEPMVTSGREVFIPVLTQEGIEGVLFAHRDGLGRRWSDHDLEFLMFAANLIGALVERQHLQERAARLEAMEEADRLKSTILTSVSHDLKTPIAAATATLSSVLDAVGDDTVDPQVVEDVASALDDLSALNVRVTELVDIARLETASWKSNVDYNDLGDLCHLVTGSLRAQERHRVTCPSFVGVPPFRLDLVQLGRALFHIVENALRYSPPESLVSIDVEYDDEHLRISVTDSGPGLSEDDKKRVFEKFYRGAASGSVSYGSGLGLSIAQRIVEIHGGWIDVADVEPTGARFTIVLPRSEEEL